MSRPGCAFHEGEACPQQRRLASGRQRNRRHWSHGVRHARQHGKVRRRQHRARRLLRRQTAALQQSGHRRLQRRRRLRWSAWQGWAAVCDEAGRRRRRPPSRVVRLRRGGGSAAAHASSSAAAMRAECARAIVGQRGQHRRSGAATTQRPGLRLLRGSRQQRRRHVHDIKVCRLLSRCQQLLQRQPQCQRRRRRLLGYCRHQRRSECACRASAGGSSLHVLLLGPQLSCRRLHSAGGAQAACARLPSVHLTCAGAQLSETCD